MPGYSPPSSSVHSSSTGSNSSATPWRCAARRAASTAAMLPFMSAVPRPTSRSPTGVSTSGSWVQPSPGGTVSVWKYRLHTGRPRPAPAIRLTRSPAAPPPRHSAGGTVTRRVGSPSGRTIASTRSAKAA